MFSVTEKPTDGGEDLFVSGTFAGLKIPRDGAEVQGMSQQAKIIPEPQIEQAEEEEMFFQVLAPDD